MPTGRADAADTAGGCPTCHGLWIDAKQAGNLSGCQEPVTVLHEMCLSLVHGVSSAAFLSDTVLLNAFAGPRKMSTRVVWSRLPLAHVSCVADKKVGVVVTRRSPYVAETGYKGGTMGYESPDGRCV